MRGVNRFLRSRKHITLCLTGYRVEATATEGTADGDTRAKQTSHPRSAKGLGHMVLWGVGQDGAWWKGCVADTSGFLFNSYFSPSPLHASPFPLPGRTLSPSLSVTCGRVIQRKIWTQTLGKSELTRGKQAQRAVSPDWSKRAGDSVNVSSVMPSGSLGVQKRLFREHFGF